MRVGTVYVKVHGEDVPVAHCTVDVSDGGVFVTEETQRGKKTMTWRRIGTLLPEARELLQSSATGCESLSTADGAPGLGGPRPGATTSRSDA